MDAPQLRTSDRKRERTTDPATWRKSDPDYPADLLDLPNPPDALFALGARSVLDPPRVAIVGTRDCTAYGDRTARKIASAIARAGGCVVSGMARGIDACVHRAALEVGGKTVAVLGTGIDVPYPRGHARLHAEIAERGLVLSESPAGTAAFRGCFPRRNRILAALAKVTIVVEAGHKSGALLTAKDALNLGRTVAAVPGPIDSPHSAGTNELLRDGAQVIATVDDALALAGFPAEPELELPEFTVNERAVWEALGKGAASIELVAHRANLSLRDCMSATTALELSGLVSAGFSGEYRRN
ncbi:MAG: DNA-processing protein DprA [Gemmatimonadaceae bacterium]